MYTRTKVEILLVHQLTQKDLKHYKVKSTPYVLLVALCPQVSVCFTLRTSVELQLFRHKCTEWTPNDTELHKATCRSRSVVRFWTNFETSVPYDLEYCSALSPNFQSSSLCSQAFRVTDYRFTEWTPNEFEHYKFNDTPYTVLTIEN